MTAAITPPANAREEAIVHIVDRLREDHQRMAELLAKIRQQTDGSAGRRGGFARALDYELAAHATFEEEVFYPALRESDDLTEVVGEAVSELHQAGAMIESMLAMDPASADFTTSLGMLEATLNSHRRREEEAIFPVAQKVIGPSQAEELSERHEAMGRNHA
jgi:iron-sulfur cluster repair protein YtfE (RIC family)